MANASKVVRPHPDLRGSCEREAEAWDVELNTKGRYAVMAMAELAAGSDVGAKALSVVAERQHISLAYLEQLFQKLRRAGLVESARGRAGGYRLARPAGEIRVADIMSAVEEDMRMTRCGGEAGTPCLAGRRCVTHGLWDALSDHIQSFLESVTLQEVLDGIPDSKLPVRGLMTAAAMPLREAGE